MKNIRFFDMFSDIGGFRAGLERAGGFECIGHCEIDKHVVHALGLRIKAAHAACVDATRWGKEADL